MNGTNCPIMTDLTHTGIGPFYRCVSLHAGQHSHNFENVEYGTSLDSFFDQFSSVALFYYTDGSKGLDPICHLNYVAGCAGAPLFLRSLKFVFSEFKKVVLYGSKTGA